MSMTDPVSDFLTRLRNAAKAQHHDVTMPSSKLKVELARILSEQGYIEAYEVLPVDHGHIPRIQGGMGTAIISTSKGVMTGHDARIQGVGGEVVANVW